MNTKWERGGGMNWEIVIVLFFKKRKRKFPVKMREVGV